MRAAVLHGKETIKIEEVELRPPGTGEVQLRIDAALTCGTDLKVYKRGYHAKMLVPPTVFGHEMAGTIAVVGPEVQGWKTGERVVVANSAPCGTCYFCVHGQENLCADLLFLNGAYAEFINVPARLVQKNMLRLTDRTEFRDAALTEPLACVVLGLRELDPQAGETCLVIGSGPIGLMFAALARDIGCRVTLAGRGEKRLATAERLGARAVQVPRETGLGSVLEGVKFDSVFEAVGTKETWEASVGFARKGGRVNFFGGCASGTKVELDATTLHYSSIRLMASFHHTPETIRAALREIQNGTIRASDFVDGETSLTELPEKFREMAEGNQSVKTFVDVTA